jgi:nitrogen fixation protein NifU and related proteins
MNDYTQQILDYSQNPPNYGKLENCNYTLTAKNPSCGDDLTIFLKVENQIITEAKFLADGCAISKAATSMLLESLIGKEIGKIENIKKEDVLNLLQIDISSTREKCAFLVLDALDTIAS